MPSTIYMDNVDLRGANLQDANLTFVVFMNADMRGANLQGIKYDRSTLQFLAGSKLEGAKMSADLEKDLEGLK